MQLLNALKKNRLELLCQVRLAKNWKTLPLTDACDSSLHWSDEYTDVFLHPVMKDYGVRFSLEMRALETPVEIRILLTASDSENKDAFHVIPSNIFGDNHAAIVKPDQFPLLTRLHPSGVFASTDWELRADRAAMPLSAMETTNGAFGLMIEPYTMDAISKTRVHNGLSAKLPASCGISMGYRNFPVTFADKMHAAPSTEECLQQGTCTGYLFLFPSRDRSAIHDMVRIGYKELHERLVYHKTFKEAALGMFDAAVHLNWQPVLQAYSDMDCKPPQKSDLTAWRSIDEIGWTGIAELVVPLIMAKELLGLSKDDFNGADTGPDLIEKILACYRPQSGLWNDRLCSTNEENGFINGWWHYLGITEKQHGAYTVGKAACQILRAAWFLKTKSQEVPAKWITETRKVLDTVVLLQRDDGKFGYGFSIHEKKVEDWDGFAGCWFVPALVYLYRLTGEKNYLESAERALTCYTTDVRNLNAFATPMDTFRAVDEEGNLAFIKGARLLHEETGKAEYLSALEAGANYEYLWRYGYRTFPEFKPLNNCWNACGGSITSVSNPHIHPMGVLVNEDLRYLAKQTGDNYHVDRAEDGDAWLMQNLEYYPDKAGYGRYGVMTERWCPSDGLTTERYSDDSPCSIWLTYNLWAAANVMEAVCVRLQEELEKR